MKLSNRTQTRNNTLDSSTKKAEKRKPISPRRPFEMKAELDAEDRERVELLRKLVKAELTEYYDTDFNLLRWLQGHAELSLNQIANKLKAHLRMRFAYCFLLLLLIGFDLIRVFQEVDVGFGSSREQTPPSHHSSALGIWDYGRESGVAECDC